MQKKGKSTKQNPKWDEYVDCGPYEHLLVTEKETPLFICTELG